MGEMGPLTAATARQLAEVLDKLNSTETIGEGFPQYEGTVTMGGLRFQIRSEDRGHVAYLTGGG